MLFAQLVDDPSSHPEKFPTEEGVDAERERLFKIIEDLVVWENSTNEKVLERARVEIRKSCGGELPPVYDPFSGGGSIPLEAQRLGLPAYGSDLNPVAVMIGKAMIEIPPRFKDREPVHPAGKDRNHYRNAEGLAEDVKYYGEWMREQAHRRIGHLYPQVELPKEHGGGKATVIAWIWARTVPSPDPAFSGVHVPMASSFLLSSKAGKEAWIEPIVDKGAKTIAYRIRKGGTKAEIAAAKAGTKTGRAVFRCLFSDTPISGEYADKVASKGAMASTLLAIVAEGKSGRIYVHAESRKQIEAIGSATIHASTMDMVHLEVPCRGTFASNAQGRRYGFNVFKDYFTDRQLSPRRAVSRSKASGMPGSWRLPQAGSGFWRATRSIRAGIRQRTPISPSGNAVSIWFVCLSMTVKPVQQRFSRKSVPAMRTRPRTSPIASTISRLPNAGTREKRRRGTA